MFRKSKTNVKKHCNAIIAKEKFNKWRRANASRSKKVERTKKNL